MTQHSTLTPTSTNPATIDALSVASEFLLCAIRALAWGADPNSDAVSKPVKWANDKIAEAARLSGGC